MSETVRIILNYVLSCVYLISVVLVGELIQKKFNTDKELTRKCEHIAASASWIISYALVGTTIHIMIVNAIALVSLTALALSGKMKSVEREDTAKSYGLIYFGLSTFIVICLVVFVNKDFIAFSGTAYYCLALGDGFAPLAAKLAKNKNVTMYAPKTLVGFLTVFFVSALVTLVFSLCFKLYYSALFIFSVASIACHAELYGRKGLDNIFIVFAVFGYLVLNYYGYASTTLQVALVICPVITILSSTTKSLTYGGGVVSCLYLILSAFFGNAAFITLVCVLFLLSAVISKVTSKIFYADKDVKKIKQPRNIWQVLANSIVAFVFVVLYFFLNDGAFMFAAIAALCEGFADSAASDIGRLSKKQPVDVLRFKRVQPGISGGVSLIGSACALAISVLAALIPFAFFSYGWQILLCVAAFGFVGTFIDSVLGSGVQALYRCPQCGAFTEDKEHCGVSAERVKGLSFIDNSTVNLLASLLTGVISFVIFYFAF